METVSVKDKIEKTFYKVIDLAKEQKNSPNDNQLAVDNLLDRILAFQGKLNVWTEKIIVLNNALQELTWITNLSEENKVLLKNLLNNAKLLHKALIDYYVKRSWAIKKGVAREAMYNLKENIDNFKEYIEDINEIFFVLREDDEFNDITKKLEEL